MSPLVPTNHSRNFFNYTSSLVSDGIYHLLRPNLQYLKQHYEFIEPYANFQKYRLNDIKFTCGNISPVILQVRRCIMSDSSSCHLPHRLSKFVKIVSFEHRSYVLYCNSHWKCVCVTQNRRVKCVRDLNFNL